MILNLVKVIYQVYKYFSKFYSFILIIFFKVNFKKLDYQIKIIDKSKFIFNSSNKVISYNN